MSSIGRRTGASGVARPGAKVVGRERARGSFAIRATAAILATGLAACGVAKPAPGTGGGGQPGATGAAGGQGGGMAAGGGGATNAGGAGGAAGASGAAGAAGAGIIQQQFPAYADRLPAPPPENAPMGADLIAQQTLGKILFWDEQLSSDDTMACGTCHRASAGGSDPRAITASATAANPAGGVNVLSIGSRNPGADMVFGTADDVHGAQGIRSCTVSGAVAGGAPQYVVDPVFGTGPQVTRRKPPTYIDAIIAQGSGLFWDGRASSTFVDPQTGATAIAYGGGLESQALGPPLGTAEMSCVYPDNPGGTRTWTDVIAKLTAATPLALATRLPSDLQQAIAAHPSYPALFAYAFHTPDITAQRIAFAIATHERRLVSDQTPWDLYNAGDKSALTPAEERGYALFLGKANCRICHSPPLFTDALFHDLGFFDSDFDPGVGGLPGQPPSSKGKIKTPTLRDAGLREAGGLFHTGFAPQFPPAVSTTDTTATLDVVVRAYNEAPMNDDVPRDLNISKLNLTPAEVSDLVDFLRNGLTDPRVKNELPPFDRPLLHSEL